MPMSSARAVRECPTQRGSKSPSAMDLTTRWALRGPSAGNSCSVVPMQDGFAQACLVMKTSRGQDGALGIHGTNQTFSLQRNPNGGIAQSRSVARKNDGFAEMEMVAVCVRWANNDAARCLARLRVAG